MRSLDQAPWTHRGHRRIRTGAARRPARCIDRLASLRASPRRTLASSRCALAATRVDPRLRASVGSRAMSARCSRKARCCPPAVTSSLVILVRLRERSDEIATRFLAPRFGGPSELSVSRERLWSQSSPARRRKLNARSGIASIAQRCRHERHVASSPPEPVLVAINVDSRTRASPQNRFDAARRPVASSRPGAA